MHFLDLDDVWAASDSTLDKVMAMGDRVVAETLSAALTLSGVLVTQIPALWPYSKGTRHRTAEVVLVGGWAVATTPSSTVASTTPRHWPTGTPASPMSVRHRLPCICGLLLGVSHATQPLSCGARRTAGRANALATSFACGISSRSSRTTRCRSACSDLGIRAKSRTRLSTKSSWMGGVASRIRRRSSSSTGFRDVTFRGACGARRGFGGWPRRVRCPRTGMERIATGRGLGRRRSGWSVTAAAVCGCARPVRTGSVWPTRPTRCRWCLWLTRAL